MTPKDVANLEFQDLARFFAQTLRKTDTGCLEWTGRLSRGGYGVFWHDSRNVSAHRVAAKIAGKLTSLDLHIDHLCRNRRCVEPDHLELVSSGDNTRRGVEARVWSATSCRNGHDLEVSGWYLDKNGTRTCRECKRVAARKHYAKRAGKILGGEA